MAPFSLRQASSSVTEWWRCWVSDFNCRIIPTTASTKPSTCWPPTICQECLRHARRNRRSQDTTLWCASVLPSSTILQRRNRRRCRRAAHQVKVSEQIQWFGYICSANQRGVLSERRHTGVVQELRGHTNEVGPFR